MEEYGSPGSSASGLVLATVISIDGSVYSRAGAMALFVSGDSVPGALPAGLQEGLRLPIEETVAGGPRLATLEMGEDDPLLGLGFGGPGRVEIFLEPVDDQLRQHLGKIRDAVSRGGGIVCSVVVEGSGIGLRELIGADHPSVRECYREMSPELIESSDGGFRRVFLCPIHPMGRAVLFGSGPEAAYLAVRLGELGFSVFVADPRPGRLSHSNWKGTGAELIEGGWEAARRRLSWDEDTSVVVMTNSLELDLEILSGALQSPAGYVGLSGPYRRTRKLLADLEASGVRPRPGVFFAPAGLDIGAETPEESALGVAAEILAVRSGRKGGKLSTRHQPKALVPHSAKTRLPGIILAAGRGKRFAAGNKLSILVEGKSVLRHVVENALASKLDPVVVVLGCDADSALKLLNGIEDPRLRVVFNPLWASGKASSIEVGLRECPAGIPGVLSLMGDMPMVKPWLINRVISEFELSDRLTFPVFPSVDGPRKGYPTVFPKSLFAEIKALTGDDTMRDAVQRHWSEAIKITLDDSETQLDVDTAQDLELLLPHAPGRG